MEQFTMNPDIILQDDGLLPLDPARVERLVESIKEVGLINPITVERRGGMVYVVAGRHRLAAVKKLKLKSVPVSVVGDTDDTDIRSLDSRLAEIDENLMRGELGPSERALLMAERKKVYLEKHPETKKGGDRRSEARRSKSQVETLKDAFIDDTAKKTGRSRATAARETSRGEELKDILRETAGTVLDKGTELDALVKLKKMDPEKADEAVKAAKTTKPVRATVVLSEAQKRRVDRLGDHIYKRIEGTALDTPDEIAALTKLRDMEAREAWGLDGLYTSRLEPFLAKVEAGKDVSASETLAEAERALAEAKKQDDAEFGAFVERFKKKLGDEYAKLSPRSQSGFARWVMHNDEPEEDEAEYDGETEDVALAPAD